MGLTKLGLKAFSGRITVSNLTVTQSPAPVVVWQTPSERSSKLSPAAKGTQKTDGTLGLMISGPRFPPEKIVHDHAPDGQPYLFLLAGTIQCFVPQMMSVFAEFERAMI